ncbi:MAG: hypothetical protein KGJ41_15455 [Rhodospirillales bacterium]|nr:hypothetical protein [Rhodospirillales bacterium]MDE2575869.1 hypothetical protein [Rhodospirillales bacterium]
MRPTPLEPAGHQAFWSAEAAPIRLPRAVGIWLILTLSGAGWFAVWHTAHLLLA